MACPCMTNRKILWQLCNVHDSAEDSDGKVEKAGNKSGNTTLPDINNLKGTCVSYGEENRDKVTIIRNQTAFL